jgi:hypothetical protein
MGTRGGAVISFGEMVQNLISGGGNAHRVVERSIDEARGRRSDTERFPDTAVNDFFQAGTSRAHDSVGGDFENIGCVRCGARIRHVFMTQHGPMGGDCIATLTGDSQTRAVFRKFKKAISNAKSNGFKTDYVEVNKSSFGGYVVSLVPKASRAWSDVEGRFVSRDRSWFVGSVKDASMARCLAAAIADDLGVEVKG